MNIELRAKGVRIHQELRAAAERRIVFALDRFEHRIVRVVVRLEDLNGPRGGDDKVCRIEIQLRGSGTLRVRSRADDVTTAVDLAAQRAAQAISRWLLRERTTLVQLLSLAELMGPRRTEPV
jgi:ribosome-associated translation inhibitor RaiA